jgi:hypothetical protein
MHRKGLEEESEDVLACDVGLEASFRVRSAGRRWGTAKIMLSFNFTWQFHVQQESYGVLDLTPSHTVISLTALRRRYITES